MAQEKRTFANGWGVSIITHGYGSFDDLLELAVIGVNGRLHYRNPVARGDVRGYLTREEAEDLAKEVEGFGRTQTWEDDWG